MRHRFLLTTLCAAAVLNGSLSIQPFAQTPASSPDTLDLKADKPIADGIVRGWFDGKPVIDRTDVVLRSTDFPEMKFNQFLLLPYFGPGLLPHAQTLWIEELAVETTRSGPAEAE